MTWTPTSWRNLEALQQPTYGDPSALDEVTKRLGDRPPLVFAGEARTLLEELACVSRGDGFLLQAGDCAESFESSADSIRDRLKVILQMAVVLTYGAGVPTVKVGRIAGQFAKPRSSDTESKDGTELPSFRGHMVNDIGFSEGERRADPNRLMDAYNTSAATLNLLRAFTKGGYADLNQVQSWNQQHAAASDAGKRYLELTEEIQRALRFMSACGVSTADEETLHVVDFFTSHEALVLPYEEALTRQDSLTGEWYDCSAHMLWIGERTRQLDGAHMEFLRGVSNPLGCKIGPTATPDDVRQICERLNPDRIPGRLTLITRVGADKVLDTLPPLLSAVKDSEHPVVWVTDPMHGNTYTANGHKTRHFDSILKEIDGFFEAHREAGTTAGGIHLELTGEDVTECLGGNVGSDSQLSERYETMCDPRLNASQALDLAFEVSELIRSR